MSKYIMRLDDACTKWDKQKWQKMEELLDAYDVKPLVGIIPHCEDISMQQYVEDFSFWDVVDRWIGKGWCIAMHGYNHVYSTQNGGINPVNNRSEFAGESLVVQSAKISKGIAKLAERGIVPKVFFAPSHTFDKNTLQALRNESGITIISDTIANKPYSKDGFTFVPQQSGIVRRLLYLHTVTFCYHPNLMEQEDFERLQSFLEKYSTRFIPFPDEEVKRKMNLYDWMLRKLYFLRRMN